jgi:hypothetical protein
MFPETETQVALIRQRMETASAELNSAQVRFGDNFDKFLSERVRMARSWLDETDTLYLRRFSEERYPPRTLAEESVIISQAIAHLNAFVLPSIKQISEWASTIAQADQASAPAPRF